MANLKSPSKGFRNTTLVLWLALAPGAQAAVDLLAGQTTSDTPLIRVNFTPDTASAILNPERGYTQSFNLIGADLSTQRVSGRTLIRGFENLAAYRSTALPQPFLDSLDAGLANVRANHLKTTIRFKYNDGESNPNCPEASKAIMLQHIAQMGPVLQKYSDVIISYEAGFIGCWGEWSGISPLQNTTDERDIIIAMLNSLPNQMVQVRAPDYKANIFNAPNPMAANDAYTGNNRARTMYYNDCILSTSDNQDQTYQSPVDFWMNYVQTEMQWGGIMGGETCASSPPVRAYCTSSAGQAQTVLASYRFTYLNGFAPNVELWKTQGCYDDIGIHLGYRFSLKSISYSAGVAPGGTLHLDVNLINQGYAAPFNPRPVYAVLDGAGGRFNLLLPASVDPRGWSGGSSQTFSVDLPVPSAMPMGNYRLSLWLPDAASGLQSDPLYAIQLANAPTIWDAMKGFNVITSSFSVVAGSSDITAIPLVTADLAGVKVYPNPWRQDKHATKNITFTSLPSGSTVKLFTVSGHKVAELKESGGSTAWDLKTDKGDPAASGIYMYLITDRQGNKMKGKAAVIR